MLFLKVIRLNYALICGSSYKVGRSRDYTLTSYVSLWLHILGEVGLDKEKPLLDTSFDVSTSVTDISNDCLAIESAYSTEHR